MSPEQLELLRDGVERTLLPTLRDDFEAGLTLVDFLEQLRPTRKVLTKSKAPTSQARLTKSIDEEQLEGAE